MSSNHNDDVPPIHDLSESHVTIPSDTESFSNVHDLSTTNGDSSSPPSSSSSPLILYQPPTILSLLRAAAINLILPFINGLMLGFGELFAHEAAFRLGWGGTRVFPSSRGGPSAPASHSMGPGIEIRDNPAERRRRGYDDLDDLTSLE